MSNRGRIKFTDEVFFILPTRKSENLESAQSASYVRGPS